MGVSLHVSEKSFEIGAASFFTSLFSTIYIRLESEDWGTRFPAIMNELYAGTLAPGRVEQALGELRMIRDELGKYSPDALVWDYEDRAKQPPWGADIAEEIRTLAEYFVTSDGKKLLDVMEAAFAHASRTKGAVTIR